MKPTSQNLATHCSKSNHTVMCVRDGVTFRPLGNTGEVMERVGCEGGQEMQQSAPAGEQREQECCRQMQTRRQSSCTDLKRRLTEVEAASPAPPGRSGKAHTHPWRFTAIYSVCLG